jgi:hypothetical protein
MFLYYSYQKLSTFLINIIISILTYPHVNNNIKQIDNTNSIKKLFSKNITRFRTEEK